MIDNPFGKTPKIEFPKDITVKPEEVKPAENSQETKPIPVEDKIEKPRELTRKEQILKEYGGLPSNIPVNHRYWKM